MTNLNTLPLEIKQKIAQYLPLNSIVNFKLCSKEMNYNYHFSKERLLELYQSKKLFSNATAFKCYLYFKEPLKLDLFFAIKQNKVDVVRVLLQDGRIDLSENSNSAIKCASHHMRFEIIKLLLKDKRVDLSADSISFYPGLFGLP
ncbi:hypothetical protein HDV02_005910 [Globomyces sp. JEL0801]|nr:hypothetical protein HDV02_005910 [Globomyces sp. JEL0801]